MLSYVFCRDIFYIIFTIYDTVIRSETGDKVFEPGILVSRGFKFFSFLDLEK